MTATRWRRCSPRPRLPAGPDLDLGRADTLCEQLRDLAGECAGGDTLVVAITARGSVVEDDLVLLPEPPGDAPGVRVGKIVASLLAGATPMGRLALLLDVGGDPEAATWAVPITAAGGAVLEVVLAATPATARAPSPFAVLFARAAMLPASGGPAQPLLTLAGIVRTLRADLSSGNVAEALTVTHHSFGSARAAAVTFPNPRHTATAVAAARFIGRRAALAAVTGWLAGGRDAPVLQVVTGVAGSGKSALLRAAAGTGPIFGWTPRAAPRTRSWPGSPLRWRRAGH
ncbi:hypothetical protein [Paractinoplanes durhamensis]|uniref:hypothetical protein n=1 Tax=Paractinoplanes durhamensis TaxID=113563 RepID=UPI00362E861E